MIKSRHAPKNMTCQTYWLSVRRENSYLLWIWEVGEGDPRRGYPELYRLAPSMMSRIKEFLSLSGHHRQESTGKAD